MTQRYEGQTQPVPGGSDWPGEASSERTPGSPEKRSVARARQRNILRALEIGGGDAERTGARSGGGGRESNGDSAVGGGGQRADTSAGLRVVPGRRNGPD